MANKKYELDVSDTITVKGKTLYRIRALRNFGPYTDVIGWMGGYVESEKNLSHEGDCWIYGDGMVFGNAVVKDNVGIGKKAMVYGNAVIEGNARVSNSAKVYGSAHVSDNALIDDNAEVYDNAVIKGGIVDENAKVYGNAIIVHGQIGGNAEVFDDATVIKTGDRVPLVYGKAKVHGSAEVSGDTEICGTADIVDVKLESGYYKKTLK